MRTVIAFHSARNIAIRAARASNKRERDRLVARMRASIEAAEYANVCELVLARALGRKSSRLLGLNRTVMDLAYDTDALNELWDDPAEIVDEVLAEQKVNPPRRHTGNPAMALALQAAGV